MTKFRPLHDRVLVLPDGAPVKTGGLSQPSSQKEEPTQGVVVAAGPQALRSPMVWDEVQGRIVLQERNAHGVAVGERVQWVKYAGRDVEHEGRKHKLLRLEEIDGILEDA